MNFSSINYRIFSSCFILNCVCVLDEHKSACDRGSLIMYLDSQQMFMEFALAKSCLALLPLWIKSQNGWRFLLKTYAEADTVAFGSSHAMLSYAAVPTISGQIQMYAVSVSLIEPLGVCGFFFSWDKTSASVMCIVSHGTYLGHVLSFITD